MFCWLLSLALAPIIEPSVADPDWLVLLDQAESMRVQGRVAEAQGFFASALAAARKTGPNDVAMSLVLHNTAFFYHQTGRLADAEPLYKQSLHWLEAHQPEYRPSAVRAVVNLAVVYVETGRWKQAEVLLQPWLEVTGAREGDVARLRGVYASVLSRQGKYDRAEAMLLSVRTEIANEPRSLLQQESLALTISNLAALYEATGRRAKALESYGEALKILWAVPNRQPVALVRTLHEAAVVQDDRTALSYYRQALELADSKLGAEHPILASVLPGYAELLKKLHRGREARKLERRAEAIRERYIKDNLLGHTVDVKAFSK